MSTKAGIREAAYFNGFLFTRGPTDVDIQLETAETRQRAIDGTLHVHRASPYVGAPMRVTKALVNLSWESLTGTDIDCINDLIAWGGPVEFTVWRPIREAFVIRSGGNGGTLQRKNATTQASPRPPNADALYAASCWQNGVEVGLSMSNPDSKGRTPWTGSVSPGIAIINYYPLFNLYVAEGQPQFKLPQLQGQTLRLEER